MECLKTVVEENAYDNSEEVIFEKSIYETMSDEELESLYESMTYDELDDFIRNESLHEIFTRCLRKIDTHYITIAKRYLYEKESMPELSLDDGSIRGLFLSNARKYLQISKYVDIQKKDGRFSSWITKDAFGDYEHIDAESSSIEEFKSLSYYVQSLFGNRLEADGIIVIAHHSINSFEPEDGVAFSEDKMYAWSNNRPDYIISYDEISKVDYCSKNIIVKTKNKESVLIQCASENYHTDYPHNMADMLYDIIDKLEANAQ